MFLSVVFDLLLVLILIFGFVSGYKRGLVTSLMKPARFFLSLLLAFSLCKMVSELLFEPIIYSSLNNQIKNYLNENLPSLSNETTIHDLPTVFRIAASVFNVDLSLQSGDAVQLIANQLSMPITRIVSVVVSFFVLYLGLRFLVKKAFAFIDLFLKASPIGYLDKLLGSVFNFIFSLFIAYCVTAVFDFVINLPIFEKAADGFIGGAVYGFFNDLNPIELLFSF